MLPIIKTYKMDYNFLINNYLDKELWNRTWILFEYKKYKISLRLYNIYTANEKINLNIRIEYNNDRIEKSKTNLVEYSLKIENIDILKNKINNAIFQVIQYMEQEFIKETHAWYNLEKLEEDEEERLTKIAEEFLDSHGITNDNIRDSYIDAYVDNTSKSWNLKWEYLHKTEYTELSDLYLIWLETTNEDFKESKLKLISKNLNGNRLKNLQEEIEEYMEYMETVEFEEEAKDKLEDIN